MAIGDRFRPLSRREDKSLEETLYEGVPPHLKEPVLQWISDQISDEEAKEIALTLHLDIRNTALKPAAALTAGADYNEITCLDVADLLLFRHGNEYGIAEELDRMLMLGGSAWRVAHDHRSLQRRVNETAQRAIATVTGSGTNASDHLATAWQAAYGRNPEPSRAYSEAIKAVEAAAIPIVSPANSRATLGTVIGDLAANQAQWRLAIAMPTGVSSIDPLLGMLRLLWQGQTDRHGGTNPTNPIPLEAGTTAVHLAVTLVQWFTSGSVTRKASGAPYIAKRDETSAP